MLRDKILLKFVYNTGEKLETVFTYAKINSIGFWNNAFTIFTEKGEFNKRKIWGDIHQEWVQVEENEEGNGQDLLL